MQVNQFIDGSILTGILGLFTFAAERTLKRAPKLHALTNTTQEFLAIIAELDEADLKYVPIPHIPSRDILGIYLNSRYNRSLANERRIEQSHPDALKLLDWLTRDHRKIRRLTLQCLFCPLRFAARLVPDCYTSCARVLLWTYADEQEVLNQLAPFCSPAQAMEISARV